MSLHLYEVDDGEQWWYVAESSDEALKMHLEPLIGRFPEDLSSVTPKETLMLNCTVDKIAVTQLADDKSFGVRTEEDAGVVEKTAAQWAADGKGFIAGTVW